MQNLFHNIVSREYNTHSIRHGAGLLPFMSTLHVLLHLVAICIMNLSKSIILLSTCPHSSCFREHLMGGEHHYSSCVHEETQHEVGKCFAAEHKGCQWTK